MTANNAPQRKGLIIHPGAIGDAILALPLAGLMKERLGVTQVDWIGRTDYVQFFPTRTAVDAVRSMDAIPMYRLFEDPKTFDLADKDPLLYSFSGYSQVVSFLGREYPQFEQNLLYTVHCNQAAQVLMLPVVPGELEGHVSDFYLRELALENEIEPPTDKESPITIEPTSGDYTAGFDLLEENDLDPDDPLIVIHPGSGGEKKCWPLDNFLLLAESLLADEKQILFLLGPAELERFSEDQLDKITPFRCLSELDLTQILQLLSVCDGYVGNDSGISHMAGAVGKSVVAVFGPTDPQKFAPRGPKARTVLIPPDRFTTVSGLDVDCVHRELLDLL